MNDQSSTPVSTETVIQGLWEKYKSGQHKLTKKGRLRAMYDDIRKLQDGGMYLKDILACLKESGFEISMGVLKEYLSLIGQERAGQVEHLTQQATLSNQIVPSKGKGSRRGKGRRGGKGKSPDNENSGAEEIAEVEKGLPVEGQAQPESKKTEMAGTAESGKTEIAKAEIKKIEPVEPEEKPKFVFNGVPFYPSKNSKLNSHVLADIAATDPPKIPHADVVAELDDGTVMTIHEDDTVTYEKDGKAVPPPEGYSSRSGKKRFT